MIRFILFCFIASQAKVINEECDRVSIEGNYYRKEILLTKYYRPYLMIVNRKTNDLYFSYSLDTTDLPVEMKFIRSASVRFNLDDKIDVVINDTQHGISHAVDQERGIVYIGAADGIYKYVPGEVREILLDTKDTRTSDMFYRKSGLVYLTFFRKMYALEYGELVHLKAYDELNINHFVFNNQGDVMFFSNDTGVYKKTRDNTFMYFELRIELSLRVHGITIDNNDRVYAILTDGLYVFDHYCTTLRRILASEDTPYGLAFDKDNNMIYSTERKVIRLVLDKSSEQCPQTTYYTVSEPPRNCCGCYRSSMYSYLIPWGDPLPQSLNP